MLSREIIKKQLDCVLDKTKFNIGKRYEGKVRDNYILNGKRVIITTDRVSAFDRIIGTIPFKGQILNQTSAFWFEKTRGIVDNHLIEVIDPNVMLVNECETYPVEVVVRGYITGVTKTSAWYNYEQGVRIFCGNELPDGLTKNQKFDRPIITPTTKAMHAHDELTSRDEIIKKGMIDEKTYKNIESTALKLFESGTALVAKNNLILVDTKYEFGNLNGKLVLIDEVHTPDSSRFWIKDTYKELFSERKEPHKLDKEYLRQWLSDKGFTGDGLIPEIPDEVKIEAVNRYIKAYEMITGKPFIAKNENVLKRIEKVIYKLKTTIN